jgi:hypothetical protein
MIQAEPLYIKQINNAKADQKKLDQTHKQIKQHKQVALKENLFVAPFHQQEDRITTDKKSFCINCHVNPVHTSNERKRSFLNMHSRYISCETCHFRPKNIQLEYHWLNFNNADNEILAKRITPFYNNESVLIFLDHPLSQQVKDIWKKGSSLKKAQFKLRLHSPLSKQGPKCLACHDNKNQLLDLQALKFSEQKIRKLQQHSIPRFFSRFSKQDQRLRMSDLLQ